MLAGPNFNADRNIYFARSRARGPGSTRRFSSCRKRSTLCAALSSGGETRCNPHRSCQLATAFTFAAYEQMIAVHDASGVFVPGGQAAALTSLEYSGEHFDAKAQQQCLRARFYDPAIGRFNRLDPFAGNMQDAQSLHKYSYVHGDPVQGVDPTGLFYGMGGMLAGLTVVMLGMSGVQVGLEQGEASLMESLVPGYGSGRGLGAAIRKGDTVGMASHGMFLTLDLLSCGGASALAGSSRRAPTLLTTEAAAEIGLLYKQAKAGAESSEFVRRV